MVAADGSGEPRQIGEPELDARGPAWSPDGSRIAFGGGDAREGIRLMIMHADGANVRPIGSSTGTASSFIKVSWSPDGTRIAAQLGGRYSDIYEWDVETGTETNLSNTSLDEIGPVHAPDGALAWETDEIGDPCCMVLLEPGGDLKPLPGRYAVWSPDGRLIATFRQGSGELILVDRDGDVALTIEDAEWPPGWQRVAA